jgi:hypothetical protein
MLNLTSDELSALADLINFHDDWDECSEQVGCDVAALYDKIMDAITPSTSLEFDDATL